VYPVAIERSITVGFRISPIDGAGQLEFKVFVLLFPCFILKVFAFGFDEAG